MTTDDLFRCLDRVESLVDRHEPDRERVDWSSAAADLAVLHQLLDECRAGLDDALAGLEAADERELVIARLAECHAGAAALLAAGGEAMSARQLIRRAGEMAPLASDLAREARAAEDDLDRFADLTCARRLWRQGHLARAQAILKRLAAGRTDALASAARAILDGPRPVTRVPTLFTWNGIGFTLVGARDGSGDGRYVTTHSFSILGIPIIPLAAYRVSDAGGGYYFHAREKLSPLARWARLLVPLSIAVLIGGFALGSYLGSTERQIRLALEAAGELEGAGRLDEALAA